MSRDIVLILSVCWCVVGVARRCGRGEVRREGEARRGDGDTTRADTRIRRTIARTYTTHALLADSDIRVIPHSIRVRPLFPLSPLSPISRLTTATQSTTPFPLLPSPLMSLSSSADWLGVTYTDGMCWRIHDTRALPLPGVGLANTLFGLLAAVTFLLILHIVYTNNRRARSSAFGGGDAASRRSSRAASGAASSSGGFFSATLASSFGLGVSDSDSASTVSFSSYLKFLQVSSLWAALWVIFNLFPQFSSGHSRVALLWHAFLGSLVYSASVFLELAVVVFLLSEGVGARAFKQAAWGCGTISSIYGACNLYFHIRDDMAPAAEDSNYPIAQMDFISSPQTLTFLAISSVAFAIFFLTTGVGVLWRTRDREKSSFGAVAGAGVGKDSESRRIRLGPGATATTTSSSGNGRKKTWKDEASSPLISAVLVSPVATNEASSSSSSGDGTNEMRTSVSTVTTSSSSSTSSYGATSPTVIDSHPSRSSSSSPSPSPSPAPLRTSGSFKFPPPPPSSSQPAPTPTASVAHSTPTPKRRSVVPYSLFLSFYYTVKSCGLLLLLQGHDGGICCLDGCILIYMLVYAFLLHYTLVQDSLYWHDLVSCVQVLREEEEEEGEEEEGEGEVGSARRQRSSTGGERSMLLTGESGTGRSGATSPIQGGMNAKKTHGQRRESNEWKDEATDRIGGALLPSSSSSSSSRRSVASISSSSSSSSLVSSSIPLRDYVIAPNQLVFVRSFVVPESSSGGAGGGGSAGTNGGGGASPSHSTSAAAAAAAKQRHRGRTSAHSHSPLAASTPTTGISPSASSSSLVGLSRFPNVVSPSSSPSTLPGGGGGGGGFASMSSRFLRGGIGGVLGAASVGGGSGGGGAGGSPSDRPCVLALSRWKGAVWTVLKQYTLPSLTPDFFRRDFHNFLQQIPMGSWLGCAALNAHQHIAQCLGVSIDPPCVSLVIEYGVGGTLFDMLYPDNNNGNNASANSSNNTNGAVSIPIPIPGSNDSMPSTQATASIMNNNNNNNTHYQAMSDNTYPSIPSSSTSSSHRPSRSFSSVSLSGVAPPLGCFGLLGPQLLPLLDPYKFLLQLSCAMAHLTKWSLYEQHPFHLSPANIMLDEQLNVLLADFSESTPPLSVSARRRPQLLSQPAWHAPEVLAGGSQTKASAVYSFAMVMWSVLTRRYPCVAVEEEEEEEKEQAASATNATAAPRSSESGSHHSVASRSAASSNTLSPPPAASSSRVAPNILRNARGSIIVSSAGSARDASRRAADSNNSTATQMQRNQNALISPPPPPPSHTRPASPSHDTVRLPLYGEEDELPPPQLSSCPPSTATAASARLDPSLHSSSSSSSSSSSDDPLPHSDSEDEEDDPTASFSSSPHLLLSSALSSSLSSSSASSSLRYRLVPLRSLKLCQRLVHSLNLRPPIPPSLSPSLTRLMEQCWDESPEDRPSFKLIEEFLRENQKKEGEGVRGDRSTQEGEYGLPLELGVGENQQQREEQQTTAQHHSSHSISRQEYVSYYI